MIKENDSLKQTNSSQKSGGNIQTFTHRCSINKPKSSTTSTKKENKK